MAAEPVFGCGRNFPGVPRIPGAPGVCVALIVLLAICSQAWPQSEPAKQPVDAALRDYYSANGLLNRGMHELAAPEYERFLKAHPDHEKSPLARYGLAVCLFRIQKMDDALKELERVNVSDGFPFAVEVSLMQGQALLARGDFAKAADALESSSKSKHDLADDASALRLEALYRAGRMDDARKVAAVFVDQWPDSALWGRVRLFQALALMADNDNEAASMALDDLLTREPDGAYANRATLLLAQCLERTGKHDEAVRRYQTVIDAGVSQTLPEALSGLSVLLVEQGDDEQAAKLLDRLITQFPDHALAASALLQRGRLRLDQNQFAQAVSDFERLAKVDPMRRDAAEFWTAKCELRSGKPADAAARLKRAISDYPESSLIAEMCFDRAVALSRADQKQNAARALKDFCQRFPDHELEPKALYLQAVLEHEQGHYDESVQLCRDYRGRFADHDASAAVEFLWAENEFMAGRLVDAARRYEQFIGQHPKDERAPSAQLRLGTALYQLEEYERAAVVLARVVDGPRTIEAHRSALLMLGDVAFRAGDWEAAVRNFDDYLSFGDDQPSAADAQLNRALALNRLGREDEALAGLDNVIASADAGPRTSQAMFEKGQILLKRGDAPAARAAFEQVVNGDPKSMLAVHAMNHLGAMAASEGRSADAAKLFAGVVKDSDDAVVKANAVFQQGQALMAAGKLEEAVAILQQFNTQWPDHAWAPTAAAQRFIALARLRRHADALQAMEAIDESSVQKLDADLRSTLLYERAWCLRELNRSDEAVRAYEQLLATGGEHALTRPAALELAEIHAAAGRTDQAVALLERLVQTEGDDSNASDVRERALHRLANCQFDLGQFEKCAATTDRFLGDYPKSKQITAVQLLAGESQFKLGRHARAADHFHMIVEQYPDDSSTATCLLRLGECLAADSKWAESQRAFETHRERFADSDLWFQSQFGIAWALENQGELDAAMTAYRAVVESHNGPTAARAQFQIGECLFAQKKHEDAVRELLKVDILYAYPEWSAAAIYETGRCFEAMGQQDNARAQFAQVLEKHADTQWAKLAGQRLAAKTNASASGG